MGGCGRVSSSKLVSTEVFFRQLYPHRKSIINFFFISCRYTPLMEAAREGYLPMVALLLEHGKW